MTGLAPLVRDLNGLSWPLTDVARLYTMDKGLGVAIPRIQRRESYLAARMPSVKIGVWWEARCGQQQQGQKTAKRSDVCSNRTELVYRPSMPELQSSHSNNPRLFPYPVWFIGTQWFELPRPTVWQNH